MLGAIKCGSIAENSRAAMAEIIDRAFGSSLGVFLPDRSVRLRVIANSVDLRAVIGGYHDAQLVGVTGFKTASVAVFDGMTFSPLRRELGARAMSARAAVALMHRKLQPDTLRIEFVAVAESVRGHGSATSMLEAIDSIACNVGAKHIELNVEPENISAQRLYERVDFQFVPNMAESLVRRLLAPQTDRRMVKELACTTF